MPLATMESYLTQINDATLKKLLFNYIHQSDEVKWEIVLIHTKLNGSYAVATIRWMRDEMP